MVALVAVAVVVSDFNQAKVDLWVFTLLKQAVVVVVVAALPVVVVVAAGDAVVLGDVDVDADVDVAAAGNNKQIRLFSQQ